jgi:hypothetical protein
MPTINDDDENAQCTQDANPFDEFFHYLLYQADD